MEFTGKVSHGKNASHYSVQWKPGFSLPLCYGSLYENIGVITRDQFVKHLDVLSGVGGYYWGYYGEASELLAAVLMAVALGIKDGNGQIITHIQTYYRPVPHPAYGPETIRKYYKQFTEEFVSEWGDTWSITSGEIVKWIDKQERREQRRETKQQTKTKGRSP